MGNYWSCFILSVDCAAASGIASTDTVINLESIFS